MEIPVKARQIIFPLLITVLLVSYFIYKKHRDEETSRYITEGRGAIKTAEKVIEPGSSRLTPIELAAWHGDYKKVREMILRGADVPADLKIRIIQKNTETIYEDRTENDSGYVFYGKTATTRNKEKKSTGTSLELKETITEYSIVHYTAIEADHEIAEKLLKKGFDFTVYDSEGYAPVHIICLRFKYTNRGFPYIKVLAENGVNLNQKTADSTGYTALEIAEKRHDDSMAAYLKKFQQTR